MTTLFGSQLTAEYNTNDFSLVEQTDSSVGSVGIVEMISWPEGCNSEAISSRSASFKQAVIILFKPTADRFI